MKKTIGVLLVLALIATVCYAQVARNSSTTGSDYDSKTNFTNIGVQGLDVAGNPGYIEIAGVDVNTGAAVLYYLWVDNTGDLKIASATTMTAMSSFPTGDWRLPNFTAGTVVGSQS